MRKLRLKFTAFILLFVLVLTACSQESGSKTEDQTGGDLIVATLSEASSLAPHIASDVPSGNVSTNIYETLTTFDEDMELKPLLAESWEAVEDNIWKFKLREGVKFHDGSEFNAEVVKANIERILDEKIASPRVILFEIVQEVKILDDYRVQFITEEPFAPLPAHMAHYASSMVSKEVIEKDYEGMENGDEPDTYINNHPIGTGYFIF
ncbi:MAG TPA: ABC transporter substrate-binding protein [Cerasibacillus sp.]|uniref:ABC transporter substrate-binding protein n=1 Tax=Cerasibacillus sp. TaxID=2498711 RepID=UPI002F3EF262